MKKLLIQTLASISLFAGISYAENSTDTAKASNPTASTTPAASASNFTAQQKADYIRTFGWIVGQQSGISELGLSNEQLNLLFEGVKMAANNEEPKMDPAKEGMNMQLYLESLASEQRTKMEKVMEAEAKTHAAEAKTYFEKLAKDSNIKKTDSGLYYQIIKPGQDPKPKLDQLVTVNYKGTLINGTVFDSSIDRGQPAEFPLNGVIPGFSEGLQLIGKGGSINLYIPSDLAYGNRQMGKIPAGSTLIFNVELIDIKNNPQDDMMSQLQKQTVDTTETPEVKITPANAATNSTSTPATTTQTKTTTK